MCVNTICVSCHFGTVFLTLTGILKFRCEVCNKEDDGSENEQNQGTGIEINLIISFQFPFLQAVK